MKSVKICIGCTHKMSIRHLASCFESVGFECKTYYFLDSDLSMHLIIMLLMRRLLLETRVQHMEICNKYDWYFCILLWGRLIPRTGNGYRMATKITYNICAFYIKTHTKFEINPSSVS